MLLLRQGNPAQEAYNGPYRPDHTRRQVGTEQPGPFMQGLQQQKEALPSH